MQSPSHLRRLCVGLLGLALAAVGLVGALGLDLLPTDAKANEAMTPPLSSHAPEDDAGMLPGQGPALELASGAAFESDRKPLAPGDQLPQEGLGERLIDKSLQRVRFALPGRIVGRVFGPDELPCSLFRVRLFSLGEKGKRHTLLSQRGRDGTFELPRIKPGTYVIEVGFGAFLVDSVRVEVQSDATSRSTKNELLFQLIERARIEGLVLDPEGEPFGLAVVSAFNPTTGTKKKLKSAADGSFALRQVDLSPWVLIAQAEGYSDSKLLPVHVHSGRARTGLELKLRPLGRVEGVVRLEDGTPAARAKITLTYDKAADPPLLAGTRLVRGGSTIRTTADKGGAFHLAPRRSGAYRLFVNLNEQTRGPEVEMDPITLTRTAIQWGTVDCGESKQHEIMLPGGAALRVEGSLCFNGELAPYRRLRLGSLAQPEVWSSEVRSDKEGKFTVLLPRLTPFKVQAWPAKPSAEYPRLTVSSNHTYLFSRDGPRLEFAFALQSDRLDLDLALGSISGRLKGESNPGVKIVLRPATRSEVSFDPATWAESRTFGDGEFEFSGVAEGFYRLHSEFALGNDGSIPIQSQWTEVSVFGGETIENVEVALPPKIPRPERW